MFSSVDTYSRQLFRPYFVDNFLILYITVLRIKREKEKLIIRVKRFVLNTYRSPREILLHSHA